MLEANDCEFNITPLRDGREHCWLCHIGIAMEYRGDDCPVLEQRRTIAKLTQNYNAAAEKITNLLLEKAEREISNAGA